MGSCSHAALSAGEAMNMGEFVHEESVMGVYWGHNERIHKDNSLVKFAVILGFTPRQKSPTESRILENI